MAKIILGWRRLKAWQIKDHSILKKEIMTFFSLYQYDVVIIAMRKCVYWLELFLRWAMRPMGLLLIQVSLCNDIFQVFLSKHFEKKKNSVRLINCWQGRLITLKWNNILSRVSVTTFSLSKYYTKYIYSHNSFLYYGNQSVD